MASSSFVDPVAYPDCQHIRVYVNIMYNTELMAVQSIEQCTVDAEKTGLSALIPRQS